MLATDRTALACDLAETYHVMDMTALPVTLLATLAAGLQGDSRIRMAMAGENVTTQETLLAAAVDRLSSLAWMQTKDGAHGRNRPPSVLAALAGKDKNAKQPHEKPVAYDTPADFERARAAILQKAR